MTRAEKQKAIDALKISAPVMAVTQEEFNDYIQTLNKVMDWLEQETITKNDLGVDCISRADVDAVIEQMRVKLKDGRMYILAEVVQDIIRELPSVTPQPCEDAVSRQEVLYLIADDDLSMGQVVRGIHALPSVTPQEIKTGHWIDKDEKSAVCSCCNRNNTLYGDFCKWCGAKMEGEE